MVEVPVADPSVLCRRGRFTIALYVGLQPVVRVLFQCGNSGLFLREDHWIAIRFGPLDLDPKVFGELLCTFLSEKRFFFRLFW